MKCCRVLSVVFKTPELHIPPWYWFRRHASYMLLWHSPHLASCYPGPRPPSPEALNPHFGRSTCHLQVIVEACTLTRSALDAGFTVRFAGSSQQPVAVHDCASRLWFGFQGWCASGSTSSTPPGAHGPSRSSALAPPVGGIHPPDGVPPP